LSPDINKNPWTQTEDRLIVEYHAQYGNQWAALAKLLPGRPGVEENHWNSTLRRLVEKGGALPLSEDTKKKRKRHKGSDESEASEEEEEEEEDEDFVDADDMVIQGDEQEESLAAKSPRKRVRRSTSMDEELSTPSTTSNTTTSRRSSSGPQASVPTSVHNTNGAQQQMMEVEDEDDLESGAVSITPLPPMLQSPCTPKVLTTTPLPLHVVQPRHYTPQDLQRRRQAWLEQLLSHCDTVHDWTQARRFFEQVHLEQQALVHQSSAPMDLTFSFEQVPFMFNTTC
jgi:hypothetical protein